MSITFRKDFGYYWPDYDHKPEACFNKVKGHITDMDLPISLCKNKNICIQAGGHAGLWAEKLSKIFKTVHTFEPDPILFECMKKNIGKIKNITMHNKCLGDSVGEAYYKFHCSAGSGTIHKESESTEKMIPVIETTLDSLFTECDALFLDVEGYELKILEGGKNLIKKCKPVILLERWKNREQLQHDYMKSIGYTFYQKSGRDLVYVSKNSL